MRWVRNWEQLFFGVPSVEVADEGDDEQSYSPTDGVSIEERVDQKATDADAADEMDE